jgi:hypothetical protein
VFGSLLFTHPQRTAPFSLLVPICRLLLLPFLDCTNLFHSGTMNLSLTCARVGFIPDLTLITFTNFGNLPSKLIPSFEKIRSLCWALSLHTWISICFTVFVYILTSLLVWNLFNFSGIPFCLRCDFGTNHMGKELKFKKKSCHYTIRFEK